jgi:hypothetical protein
MIGMFRRPARILLNGYPSVEVAGLIPRITVKLPEPFSVFTTVIRGERNYSFTTDLRRELPEPASASFNVQVSDKGQRYRGTIDLFKSLGIIAHYFERCFGDRLSEI